MSKEILKFSQLNIELNAKDFKFDMTVDASADYATNAKEYFTKAMIGENSSRSKFRLISNVKDRAKLGNVVFDSTLKAGACDFDPTDSTIKQITLEVCPLMVGTTVCVESLEASFISEQLKSGSNEMSDKIAFMDYFYKTLSETVAEELEYLTWSGDTALGEDYLIVCDGLIKKLNADAAVVKATGSAVTSANVIAKLVAARNGVAKAVRNKSDFAYQVSQDVADAYLDAIAAGSSLAYYNAGDKSLNFQGKEVIIAEGAPANTIVASQLSNFIFTTDLVSDENSFNVVDFMKTVLNRKLGVRTDFKFGVHFTNPSQIYIHTFTA